jgi:hypothetical protein
MRTRGRYAMDPENSSSILVPARADVVSMVLPYEVRPVPGVVYRYASREVAMMHLLAEMEILRRP